MNKPIVMKISAIVASAITIYTVIIWEPGVTSESLDEKNNYTNSHIEETMDNNIGFQINEVENLNNPKDEYTENKNTSIEGLGSVVLKEKSFDDLINKVSLNEKDEINEVVKKLSITDCSKIDNFLNQGDGSNGVNEAFEFIKKRLSAEDYEKFQDIISRYIDFTNVNSNL